MLYHDSTGPVFNAQMADEMRAEALDDLSKAYWRLIQSQPSVGRMVTMASLLNRMAVEPEVTS